MSITVAFTVSCLRQKYLRSTLDSWAQVRGVQDVKLLFCLEPVPSSFPVGEFKRWVSVTFPQVAFSVAEHRLGCLANTKRAVDLAFAQGADFTILNEEDMHVSADALEYYRWAIETYRQDERVQVVCAHSFRAHPATTKAQVCQIDWFSPIVWGTWKDRWEGFVRNDWAGILGNMEAWDTNLRYRIRQAGLTSVFPCRSRSLHIGEQSTLTGPGELSEYFYKNSVSATFVPDHGKQVYEEIPRTPELELVV